MGGTNPYIRLPKVDLPKQKYSIEFQGPWGSKTVEVDPAAIPSVNTGLKGSILDIGLASGVDIDHACGGVCACSTCHVLIKQGADTINPATEDEDDQLEEAPGLKANSRLGCQSVPNGTKNIIVEIPNWNRNLVRE